MQRKDLIEMGKDKLELGQFEIRLLECVAKGGMSLVYRAKLGDMSVLVKEMFPKVENEDIMRESSGYLTFKDKSLFQRIENNFKSEYAIMCNMEEGFENIKPICYEHANGTCYIVMDYSRGKTLQEYINTQKIMTIEEKFHLIIKIAQVVRTFHEKSLVHLDITPNNIWLLDNIMGEQIVKIIDYGCMTEVGQKPIIYTRSKEYAPYDIYRNEVAEYAYDTYAICAILYQLLQGSFFDGNIDDVVLDKSFKESVAPLPETGKRKLVRILRKGLSIVDSNRYSDIRLLINDLEECINFTKRQHYIESNINYKYFKKKADERKNIYCDSGIIQYHTNHYEYAVNVLVWAIKKRDAGANISILMNQDALRETFKQIHIKNNSDSYTLDIKTIMQASQSLPEKYYFIIMEADEKLKVELAEYTFVNISFLLLNKTMEYTGVSNKIIDSEYIDSVDELREDVRILFDVIGKVGILSDDLRAILEYEEVQSKQNVMNILQGLTLINGYCYRIEKEETGLKRMDFDLYIEKSTRCRQKLLSYYSRRLKEKKEIARNSILLIESVLQRGISFCKEEEVKLILEYIYSKNIQDGIDVSKSILCSSNCCLDKLIVKNLVDKLADISFDTSILYSSLLRESEKNIKMIIQKFVKFILTDGYARKSSNEKILKLIILCEFLIKNYNRLTDKKLISDFEHIALFRIDFYCRGIDLEEETEFRGLKQYIQTRNTGYTTYLAVDFMVLKSLLKHHQIDLVEEFANVLAQHIQIKWLSFYSDVKKIQKDDEIVLKILKTASKTLYTYMYPRVNIKESFENVISIEDSGIKECLICKDCLLNSGNYTIGVIFYLNNDYMLAKEWFKRTFFFLDLMWKGKKHSDETAKYNTKLHKIGTFLKGRGDVEILYANRTYLEALKIDGKFISIKNNLKNQQYFSLLVMYAETLFMLKEYIEALEIFLKAKEFFIEYLEHIKQLEEKDVEERFICPVIIGLDDKGILNKIGERKEEILRCLSGIENQDI